MQVLRKATTAERSEDRSEEMGMGVAKCTGTRLAETDSTRMSAREVGASKEEEEQIQKMLPMEGAMWRTAVEREAQGASWEPHWRAEEPVSWWKNIWRTRKKVMKGRRSTSRSGSVGGVGGDGVGEGREVKWWLRMERGEGGLAVSSTYPLSSSRVLRKNLVMVHLKWAASTTANSMMGDTNTFLPFHTSYLVNTKRSRVNCLIESASPKNTQLLNPWVCASHRSLLWLRCEYYTFPAFAPLLPTPNHTPAVLHHTAAPSALDL